MALEKRIKTEEERRFISYVMDNCKRPDGGTATSYETALFVLNRALKKARPAYATETDVWKISDPAAIHALYKKILVEQREFINHGRGIFAAIYTGEGGSSYYEKRWCSAALRFLERFRLADGAALAYEDRLEAALAGEHDSGEAAKKASKVSLRQPDLFLPQGINPKSRQGREMLRRVKVRCNQRVFRKAILNNYQHKCCICGVSVDAVLDAAHIRDWAEDLSNALDSENGLCLSATYHRAYDAHLLEIDKNYKICLSKTLKEVCTKAVYQKFFGAYDGKAIAMPIAFLPDKKALEEHCKLLVA